MKQTVSPLETFQSAKVLRDDVCILLTRKPRPRWFCILEGNLPGSSFQWRRATPAAPDQSGGTGEFRS